MASGTSQGGLATGLPLAGRHPSHAPATRNSPNRRDRAGGLGLDGDNRADETVASCELGNACDRAADHRLAAASPNFANLLRASPGCGGLALDGGNRADDTRPSTTIVGVLAVRWPITGQIQTLASRARYAQQLRPTRL